MNSEKGRKLNRLLNQTSIAWSLAQKDQAENLARREVRPMSPTKIADVVNEWHANNAPITALGQKPYMLLSLGHPYLDSLANYLHIKQWNITPHEVCTKIQELGGPLEEPWQTFKVQKAAHIVPLDDAFEERSIMIWLSHCCEIYPEWREAIATEVQLHINPQQGLVAYADLDHLCAALQEHGRLPESMVVMFDLLTSTAVVPDPIIEAHWVWYHIPSRMFNLTQLHRLATPEHLQMAINEDYVHCDNFVEVRGDPKIEGCYAPLALLVEFASVLGLELPQHPDLTVLPTYDPSDFSEVQAGRIVLARPGMLGFGSMTRGSNQCNFLNPKALGTYETISAFHSTNFGNMKVLPKLPGGTHDYQRPEHWWKYKTAEETEASLAARRKILQPRFNLQNKGKGRADSDNSPGLATSIDQPALLAMLRDRERVRAEARPPRERVADSLPSREPSPADKRARLSESGTLYTQLGPEVEISERFIRNMDKGAQSSPVNLDEVPEASVPDVGTASFQDRNSALFPVPPADPSFTQPDDEQVGDETLEKDWEDVEIMLSNLNDDEDAHMGGMGEDDPLFGFKIHDDTYDERTEPSTSFNADDWLQSSNQSKKNEPPASARPGISSVQGRPRGKVGGFGPRVPSRLATQSSPSPRKEAIVISDEEEDSDDSDATLRHPSPQAQPHILPPTPGLQPQVPSQPLRQPPLLPSIFANPPVPASLFSAAPLAPPAQSLQGRFSFFQHQGALPGFNTSPKTSFDLQILDTAPSSFDKRGDDAGTLDGGNFMGQGGLGGSADVQEGDGGQDTVPNSPTDMQFGMGGPN